MPDYTHRVSLSGEEYVLNYSLAAAERYESRPQPGQPCPSFFGTLWDWAQFAVPVIEGQRDDEVSQAQRILRRIKIPELASMLWAGIGDRHPDLTFEDLKSRIQVSEVLDIYMAIMEAVQKRQMIPSPNGRRPESGNGPAQSTGQPSGNSPGSSAESIETESSGVST